MKNIITHFGGQQNSLEIEYQLWFFEMQSLGLEGYSVVRTTGALPEDTWPTLNHL